MMQGVERTQSSRTLKVNVKPMLGRMQTFNMQRTGGLVNVSTNDIIEEEVQGNSESEQTSKRSKSAITKSMKDLDSSSIASVEIDSSSVTSISVTQASVSIKPHSRRDLQYLAPPNLNK